MREKLAAATELLLIGTRYLFPVRLSTMPKCPSCIPSGSSESRPAILIVFRPWFLKDRAARRGGIVLGRTRSVSRMGDRKHPGLSVPSTHIPSTELWSVTGALVIHHS